MFPSAQDMTASKCRVSIPIRTKKREKKRQGIAYQNIELRFFSSLVAAVSSLLRLNPKKLLFFCCTLGAGFDAGRAPLLVGWA
jgi:hypothetical protein